MVKVKICGVTRPKDLKVAIKAGADYVGFIVDVATSPRNLQTREARRLIDMLPGGVESVVVTVFNGIERAVEICKELAPDFIQLHGIAPELCSWSGSAKIIAAVGVGGSDVVEQARSHSRFAQAILVDTCNQVGHGGTGLVHDWALSRKIRDAIFPRPMILAGGLTTENVGRAIHAVKPFGVDVSTGVEARPGIKDPAKIVKFIRRVREAAS
ncbi:phosphoribosylanthranilate isomerase [Candidatus Bathyarchaeota archaeon]|nr:phosphoribosylanthranilate isomerase [Candidatus Bathyarchaeota archaeon]